MVLTLILVIIVQKINLFVKILAVIHIYKTSTNRYLPPYEHVKVPVIVMRSNEKEVTALVFFQFNILISINYISYKGSCLPLLDKLSSFKTSIHSQHSVPALCHYHIPRTTFSYAMNDMVGRTIALKDVHILTLTTCHYVMWQER